MGLIVNGEEREGPAGVVVRNYRGDPGVVRFQNRARPRGTPVNALVLHETVTTSWESTVDVLRRRGLGVHLIVGPDGALYQHADLLADEMWHAMQFNTSSVGVEVVNPYEPRFLRSGDPWAEVIEAPWAAGDARAYVLPTRAQAEAVCQVVDWVTSALANPVAVPQLWPGLEGTHRMKMGRVSRDVTANPGVHAHMYFGHADGAWLVLYSWLRLEAGLGVQEAYDEARRLATGAHSSGVDLSPYFAANPYLEA